MKRPSYLPSLRRLFVEEPFWLFYLAIANEVRSLTQTLPARQWVWVTVEVLTLIALVGWMVAFRLRAEPRPWLDRYFERAARRHFQNGGRPS